MIRAFRIRRLRIALRELITKGRANEFVSKITATEMALAGDCPRQRGRPVLAQGLVAQETLQWLQEVSKPFGTEITIADDVGIIRP